MHSEIVHKSISGKKSSLYLIILAAILFTVICSVVRFINKYSEQDCYDEMNRQLERISETINDQILQDTNTIKNIADSVAQYYDEVPMYCETLVLALHDIGMISSLQLLLPDGTLITEDGRFDVSDRISFTDEARQDAHVTGLVHDFLNREKRIVQNICPVRVDGEIVAVLYGIVDLDTMRDSMLELISTENTSIYLVEGTTGEFIVDTWHDELGNIFSLGEREMKRGFTSDKMISDLATGTPGYSIFISRTIGTYLYMAYRPAEINDWQIILTMPQDELFSDMNSIRGKFITIIIFTVVIIAAYLFITTIENRRLSRLRLYASEVRSFLLEVTGRDGALSDALALLRTYMKAELIFFIDCDSGGSLSAVVRPGTAALTAAERNMLHTELPLCLPKKEIIADANLAVSHDALYRFMRLRGIKRILLDTSSDSNGSVSILCAVDPSGRSAKALLNEVHTCFAVALRAKQHLDKTESEIITDPLTGVLNRAGARQLLAVLKNKPDYLGCVYIDVNELHSYNNVHGHEAGDKMLRFISDTLRDEFRGAPISRIGGDEFLIFTQNRSEYNVLMSIRRAEVRIKDAGYRISAGAAFGNDPDELIAESERRMMFKKAQYYAEKGSTGAMKTADVTPKFADIGSRELDLCLPALCKSYYGIYFVNLATDTAYSLLGPSYFAEYIERYSRFSRALKEYMGNIVTPEDRRRFSAVLDISVINEQLSRGMTVSITYTRHDGKSVLLSIYPSGGSGSGSVWVFEKQ